MSGAKIAEASSFTIQSGAAFMEQGFKNSSHQCGHSGLRKRKVWPEETELKARNLATVVQGGERCSGKERQVDYWEQTGMVISCVA